MLRGAADPVTGEPTITWPPEDLGFPSREDLVHWFAWAIPSPWELRWLTRALDGRPLLEIGAGTGYWVWQLGQLGHDVLAYDVEPGKNEYGLLPYWYPIQEGGPGNAADHADRALILCWPPYSEDDSTCMAAESLNAYRGTTLVYIGEWRGCCAGPRFFDLVERKWKKDPRPAPPAINFNGIYSHVNLFHRQ